MSYYVALCCRKVQLSKSTVLSTAWYSTAQHSTSQYSTLHYLTVQYITVQYSKTCDLSRSPLQDRVDVSLLELLLVAVILSKHVIRASLQQLVYLFRAHVSLILVGAASDIQFLSCLLVLGGVGWMRGGDKCVGVWDGVDEVMRWCIGWGG